MSWKVQADSWIAGATNEQRNALAETLRGEVQDNPNWNSIIPFALGSKSGNPKHWESVAEEIFGITDLDKEHVDYLVEAARTYIDQSS